MRAPRIQRLERLSPLICADGMSGYERGLAFRTSGIGHWALVQGAFGPDRAAFRDRDKLLLISAASRLTLGAMKLLPHLITIVCLMATFIANAGEQLTTKAKGVVNQPTNAELQLLQGTWEGVLIGDRAHQKLTITITGNSLHFHRDTNFWFETTMTLPAGKDPKQLHATIKGCPPSQGVSLGQVVRAFFKVEDGTLTLATIGDDAEETLKSFEAAGTRYQLRRVQPQKENSRPPKSN